MRMRKVHQDAYESGKRVGRSLGGFHPPYRLSALKIGRLGAMSKSPQKTSQ